MEKRRESYSDRLMRIITSLHRAKPRTDSEWRVLAHESVALHQEQAAMIVQRDNELDAAYAERMN
jgi:hypothetical protein